MVTEQREHYLKQSTGWPQGSLLKVRLHSDTQCPQSSPGASLFQDSKITSTLKYQTAAVGSRRKQLNTCTYMHAMCTNSCCKKNKTKKKLLFHDTSARNKHHFVKRKLFIQQWIYIYCNHLFCSKGTFSHMRIHLIIIAGKKQYYIMSWSLFCKATLAHETTTLCIVRCHWG